MSWSHHLLYYCNIGRCKEWSVLTACKVDAQTTYLQYILLWPTTQCWCQSLYFSELCHILQISNSLFHWSLLTCWNFALIVFNSLRVCLLSSWWTQSPKMLDFNVHSLLLALLQGIITQHHTHTQPHMRQVGMWMLVSVACGHFAPSIGYSPTKSICFLAQHP